MTQSSTSAKASVAGGPADYDIVIVGSGPAGLSAAARAQALGLRLSLIHI